MNIGDFYKITTVENRVFRICGFTRGAKLIPDGWPLDESGTAINPRYIKPYDGAKSVFRK